MKNVLSATEARNRFFEILDLAIYKNEEFTIEKAGVGQVKVAAVKRDYSPAQIDKIIADVRKLFAKSKKRKYWSVIDTPAWKKKERKYLKDLSEGKLF